MKKIISCFLAAMVICAVLSGCKKVENTLQTSSGSNASAPAASKSEAGTSGANTPDTDASGSSAPGSGISESRAAASLENLFTTIDLMDATITGLQAEMEAGNVTSERLTRMYIDRIEAYDEKLRLNSIISINPNALTEARELDQERSEGKVRGPLHGIPIVVKANIDVAGMATSAGALVLSDMVAAEDAFIIKQLKEAGAVILAQANMSEFAQAAYSSRSTLGGYVHNAYDTTKTPAGSSGGTAVAVTCNFAAAGIGTDTGGSIRNPSSFANLYGIKPSKGLTSTSGVLPLKAYKDTTGPMTRTAEDLALMLEIMAGTDEADDYTLEADADALLGDGYTGSLSADALKGMRIGYLEYSFFYSFSDEEQVILITPDYKINKMFHKAMANLKKAGAELVDLSEILKTDTYSKISEDITEDPFEYDLNKYLNGKGDGAKYKTVKELKNAGSSIMHMNLTWLGPDSEELADSFEKTKNPYSKKVGSYQRLPQWKDILKGREKISKAMEKNDIDAIMYLNFFDVAGKEEAIVETHQNGARYDATFGSTLGLPDITLPMGFSDPDEEYTSEMPLGLSVFAGFGQEETLMQIAYAYEQQAGDSIRRMPEQTPALEDKALTAFLEELIEKVYSIDYSQYREKPEGKVQLMLNACEKAENVDTTDPCATYEAARTLAEKYDSVMAALNSEP